MSTNLIPDEIDHIIYHHPCPDGTGSAYIAWKYLSTKFPKRNIVYEGSTYSRTPPDVTGKNVLLCDITFKKHYILEMISKANKLLIIDHHKSAKHDLEDIPDKYKIFDMDHSGATLAWMYFHPNKTIPLLIQYIEDRDIWKKELPDSDAFSSWFQTVPLDFEEYDKYIEDDILVEHIQKIGIPYRQLNENYIETACKYVVPKFSKIGNYFYFIGYINSTVLRSDIGNAIFNYFPYIDFSVVYSINDYTDSTSFSLRSTNKHIDVSSVAYSLGGGGHRNASGHKVPFITNKLPSIVYDSGRLYHEISKLYYSTLEINEIIYNIVYLNCCIHKSKLATYFLQTKYMENTKPVQMATSIIKIRHNNPTFNLSFHIAAVWHYDGVDDITDFSVILHDKMDISHKTNILSKFDIHNGLKYYGYHTTIPLSIQPM